MPTTKRRSYKNKQRNVNGGAGAANHVIAVAGNMGQQVAGTGNVLKLVDPAAATVGGADPVMGKTSMAPASFTGGKRKSKKEKGGNLLVDIALPVAFVTARKMYTNRKSNKKYMGKSSSKSRRASRRV